MENNPAYKVTVLGGEGVGKTALIIQFLSRTFVEFHEQTIEEWYSNPAMMGGQTCSLLVLDTAGLGVYKHLDDQWIRDAEGLLLVYSVSSRKSFDQIQSLIERHNGIFGSSSRCTTPPTAGLPIMLVGNQCDKRNREVSTYEASTLSRKWSYGFLETSAKNHENVEVAFCNVIRRLQYAATYEDWKRQSQSAVSGVPEVEKSIRWARLGQCKRALRILCGSQRTKEA